MMSDSNDSIHFILGHSATASLRAFPDAKIVTMVDHYDYGPCRFEASDEHDDWLSGRLAWWDDDEHPAFRYTEFWQQHEFP